MQSRSWTQRRRPWIRRFATSFALCAAVALLSPSAWAQGMCGGGMGGGGMGGGGMGGGGMGGGGMGGRGMGGGPGAGVGTAMQFMVMAQQARQMQEAYLLEQQQPQGSQNSQRMCHRQMSQQAVRETPSTPQSRTDLREKYQLEKAARREAYLAKRQQKRPAAPTLTSSRPSGNF